MRRAASRLASVAVVLLHAAPARAHSVGVSRGEYRVAGGTVEAHLTFARSELATAIPGLDADHDGSISSHELAAAEPLLARVFVAGLEVRSDAGTCAGALAGASLAAEDGVAIRAAYRCGRGAHGLSIRAAFLGSLAIGHRHLAALAAGDGEPAHTVLYESRPELAAAASPDGVHSGSAGAVAWSLFRLGVEHILTGYDHLVFLLGLILVGGRLRSLLVVVTAFTLAHSLTLGLAALGAWAPSPGLVEPAIALSIAYVGVENWFVRDATRRWRITFPFGLVHGFGFAGALGEIALPAGQVPLALAAFNLGVEAGQLAVLAAVLPVVLWLGRREWFADRGVKGLSAAIALAGLGWFVSRVA
jgi:hypothetical protein